MADSSNVGETGAPSYSDLISDSKGNLYGTTLQGGVVYGSVFRMTPKGDGTYNREDLFRFDPSKNNQDVFPSGRLYVNEKTGAIFGTTHGESDGATSKGTVFQLTPDSQGQYKLNPIHAFGGKDGATPDGGLVSDGNGNLYGTTSAGGDSGNGTVFSVTPDGAGGFKHTALYSFTGGKDGANPAGELTFDPKSGTIYGTTAGGGESGKGTVYALSPNGTGGFNRTTLASLGTGDTNSGASPNGVIVDSSGNLYGTTSYGGKNNAGTVFEVEKGSGTAKPLASLDGNSEGGHPNGLPVIDAKGTIYATTTDGGANGKGTVFSLAKGADKVGVVPSTDGGYTSLRVDDSGNILNTSVSGAVYKIPPTQTGYATTPPSNNAPCYCTGTRILTDRGEVAVEDLAIGDVVVTASGEHRTIKWIGNRGYTGRFANTNPAVLPVCVKAGALADAVPARDLWVSPDHALFLDGVLIPAERLVNGVTVVKAERVETVTYWHVELDSHDVLVAEGAAAESFVDDGGRAIFHNAASFRTLYPSQPARIGAAAYCAPRVEDGYALEAVRRRLAQRAGLPVAPARVFGELVGHLDQCDGTRVSGWAQDRAYPDAPVCLDIVVDGTVVALAYAEAYRADLAAAGIGDGRHAFDLDLPQPLDADVAHVVSVRRSADGVELGTLRVEPTVRIVRAA
ncbi:hypothetical protein MBRA_03232 [Methylobacterium brachiatum]|nr:hypothetical protein MBRA_03232 [Methylobacterium brachiatum]